MGMGEAGGWLFGGLVDRRVDLLIWERSRESLVHDWLADCCQKGILSVRPLALGPMQHATYTLATQ